MIWLAVAALCALSFLFAGMEAGLLSVDPVRLRYEVKQRTRGARRLTRLLEHPERVLVTVLIVTNVADIFALLLSTRALIGSFGRAGYVIVVLAAAPIYLFLLGVLPKALFRRFPIRALGGMAGILTTASNLLRPLLMVGSQLGRLLLPRRKSDRARLFAAREELKQVAVQSEREGSLTATERAMIHNVVDFRKVRARDVMRPIAESLVVRPQTPASEIVELSRSSGMNCFPILSADGRAVGQISALDLLFERGALGPLASHTRRIISAEESEPAYRIIRRLRAARVGLAAIVDAERRVIGIATDSELIRRLVQSA